MILFYTDDIQDGLATLAQEEARHCLQSLRKKSGDTIQFVDGKGGFYEGEIIEASKKKCVLSIKSVIENYNAPDFQLHIAIAPTKNISRFEWFLEKTTEFGISTVTPLLCQRSERKNIRTDRLRKIMLTAMKQSLKAYLPKLNELSKFQDFIKSPADSSFDYFIAHCHPDKALSHLKDVAKKNKNICILIGPEGDFSKEEVELALQQGYEGISLGKSRLRTETAGIAACHISNLINTAD